MKINLYENNKQCCGCSACEAVCQQNAIFMKQDCEGFLYPDINREMCVECGACVNVCSFKQKEVLGEPLKVYAVKNKNEKVRANSTSGGMFTALYTYVIENDGVVYGAEFDSDFSVIHKRAQTKKDCEAMRGSKYVQSVLSNSFVSVKEDLISGKMVLFTGTPCQVAGLKTYLKNIDVSKLYTVDLVCHGVPSPLIWREYIKFIQKKHKITSINFRDKFLGWHNSSLNVSSKDKILVFENHGENAYSRLYFEHYIMRPSCSECQYSCLARPGDITLGDFWGIEDSMPDFDDDKGISLVLVNSGKGYELFQNVSNSIDINETKINYCLQPNLVKPSQHAINREGMWKDYHRKGIEYILKMYTPYGNKFIHIRLRKKISYIKSVLLKFLKN